MRILIDINHPAHVHLFKNFAHEMQRRGHGIFLTARDKEVSIDLLKHGLLDFVSFGKHYPSKPGKIYGLLKFNRLLLKYALKFKPDIFLSHGSVYAAQVAWLMGKPHISMEDTGNMEQIRLYKPFTNVILTSTCFNKNLGEKQIYYNGYHELAYLHPNYFKPDNRLRSLLKFGSKEKYVILRFVSWNASHDIGHEGISIQNKIRAVKEFSKYTNVFISSEGKLPTELNKFQIRIPPEKMHNTLFYATLMFGESATMASECAVLGTPAIYVNNANLSYTNELESKFGLIFNYGETMEDQERSIQHGIELLQTPNLTQEWQKRRQRMLQDKIDVTAFLVWFVENYPESVQIMKKNPDYQYNFK